MVSVDVWGEGGGGVDSAIFGGASEAMKIWYGEVKRFFSGTCDVRGVSLNRWRLLRGTGGAVGVFQIVEIGAKFFVHERKWNARNISAKIEHKII